MILKTLHALKNDTSGLAMIEMAFCVPILLGLGLGGLEAANYRIAAERLDQMAMLVVDNASRVRDSIDETNVNEIMQGAKLVGQSIDFAANGRVILSDVQQNGYATGQWIRWQRCMGAKVVSSNFGVAGKGKTDSSLPAVGPAGNQISPQANTIVMFVEIFYDYQPITPWDKVLFGSTSRTMSLTRSFAVRQRAPQPYTGTSLSNPPTDILNANNLTGTNVASCSTYSA